MTFFNFMQPFYIGGGDNSQSVLAGFEPVILETAFNVSLCLILQIMLLKEL